MLGAEVDKPRKYSKIFENSGKRPFKAISTCQRPRFAAVWARAEAFQAAFQELSSEVDLGTQLDGGEAAGLGLLEVHRLAQALSEKGRAVDAGMSARPWWTSPSWPFACSAGDTARSWPTRRCCIAACSRRSRSTARSSSRRARRTLHGARRSKNVSLLDS